MYLRKLKLHHFKLLRDVEIDFTRNGEPRPFTVLLGENGLCKTSLLQAIALAAAGADLANKIALPLSYIDLRRPTETVKIEADFSFSHHHHPQRSYPGLSVKAQGNPLPPRLRSQLEIEPGLDSFLGSSRYITERVPSAVKDARSRIYNPPRMANPPRASNLPRRLGSFETKIDPLNIARGRHLGHWFIAAYGIGRNLPMPGGVSLEQVSRPSHHRLLSLFETYRPIVGTGFADLLPNGRSAAFRDSLEEAFVKHGILPPRTRSLSLESISSANNAVDRFMAHHLSFDGPRGDLNVPTVWLSQGYQATMAWVADLVGQVWWEADKQAIPLDEMEGICLIDEIDLHLHPLWQVNLVSALKAAFPRIQFIATTHSPMVLPGLLEDEIIRLEQDDQGNVVTVLPKIAPALKTGTELYSDFFDIKRLEPRALDEHLFRYGTLAGDPARSDDEEEEMTRLKAHLVANGIDPGPEPVSRKLKKKATTPSARKKVRRTGTR